MNGSNNNTYDMNSSKSSNNSNYGNNGNIGIIMVAMVILPLYKFRLALLEGCLSWRWAIDLCWQRPKMYRDIYLLVLT